MKMKAKTYTRPEEYICEQFTYIPKLRLCLNGLGRKELAKTGSKEETKVRCLR